MQLLYTPNWDNKNAKSYLTGYFRDGERRIDLILATTETKSIEVETAKLNFLISAVDAGFDIEIEPGVKPKNSNLWFIKIHAPIHLLRHFSYLFNIRKYFKANHLDLMKAAAQDEINLIKLVRNMQPDPLTFSSYERSMIVYRILHAVTFGAPSNYKGLHKLVHNNIITAVYPLHEGPHFLTRRQIRGRLNGRQALFYRWVGYKNLLRRQPIHLIREYMGERIAFLFAFYEYNMLTIAIPALLGIVVFLLGHFTAKSRKMSLGVKMLYDYPFYDEDSEVPKYTVRYERKAICPKCADFVGCPFKNLTAYKKELAVKNWLDNPYTLPYCLVIAFWGVLFHALWVRREHYLNWLWEVSDEAKGFPRPEYIMPSSLNEKPKRGKIRQLYIELAQMGGLLCSYVLFVFPNLLNLQFKLWNRMRYVAIAGSSIYDHRYTYFVTAFVANINGIVVVLLDKFYQYAAMMDIRKINPRTFGQFELEYMIKMFGLCFLSNFGFICFFAYFKGALYTYPNDESRWKIPFQLGMLNCGMLGCIDEVFIVYFATFKAKRIFKAVLEMREYCKIKNDLPITHQQPEDDVPCWEREYELMPIDSEFVMKKYNHIFIDIVEATFFLPVFPLSVLLSLLLNIWEIRSWATFMLLKCRRPLIIEEWGIGSWRLILMILPHAMILSSAVTFARTTNYFDRALFTYTHKEWKYSSFYIHYYSGFFNTSEYLDFKSNHSKIKITSPMQAHYVEYNKNFYNTVYNDPGLGVDWPPNTQFPEGGPVHFCLFPGQYNRPLDESKTRQVPYKYEALPGHWYILWHKAVLVLLCQMLTIIFALLIHNLIKEKNETIENVRDAEEAIRHFHIQRELLKRTEHATKLAEEEDREEAERREGITPELRKRRVNLAPETRDYIQQVTEKLVRFEKAPPPVMQFASCQTSEDEDVVVASTSSRKSLSS